MKRRAWTFVDFVAALAVVLTPAQRVLALVAFDGLEPRDLQDYDREIARALFGDVDVIPPLARAVLVAVCGARSGKSYLLGALRLLHLAITVDLSRLAPGEVAAGLIVAPDVRLARQTLRYVSGACEHPSLVPMVVASTADSITIQRRDGRRVSIECLPASRGGSAVRGRSLVGAILDEAAFFLDADLGHVVNDVEIFKAVTPRVVRGGQTIVASTPWVRAGVLWSLFSQNVGKHVHALACTAPTLLMRDWDSTVAAVVEREQARDPANAEREYGASFVDGSASLLASADIEACRDGVASRPPRPDIVQAGGYAMCVDLGTRHDRTAILVGHVEHRVRAGQPHVRILVVDEVRVLVPKPLQRVTLDQIDDAIGSVASKYRIGKVTGDRHLADALAPRLAMRGIQFLEAQMTPQAQEGRATTLAAHFSALAVKLVENETLISELKDLRLTRHAGGRVSVAAQGSRHDDAADCMLLFAGVAGDLPACGGDAGIVEWRHDGLSREEEGIVAHRPRWVELAPDGSERPAAMPTWAPGFANYARDCINSGDIPTSVMQWLSERGWRPGISVDEIELVEPTREGAVSVPIQHEGFEWQPRKDPSDTRKGWLFGK